MNASTISAEFPYESKYLTVNGSEIHYVEEGLGDPILFIHGNPTSSYIWRNIIPHLSSDARCIAVDLIGFGQSGKPDIDYGFTDTYGYLEGFIKKMGLINITLVVQDWGSGLGFHYANLNRDNIKGLAFMEAMYKPTLLKDMPKAKQLAMKLIQTKALSWLMLGMANQFVKYMLPEYVERSLSKSEMAAYSNPFKTLKSRKPVWVFPRDVPVDGKPVHTAKAVGDYHQWLTQTQLPKLCFYADPGMLIPIEDVPWIKENLPNITMIDLGKGTHYVQEDYPHEIGKGLLTWYRGIT